LFAWKAVIAAPKIMLTKVVDAEKNTTPRRENRSSGWKSGNVWGGAKETGL